LNNAAQQIPPALLKTPLWQLHKDMGGKMVGFAGYDMPVQYDGMGVLKEHLHTRTAAGLFDVSHMGQAVLTATHDPAADLEKIVPGDIAGLGAGKTRYTVLLNDNGGIIDDLMVTRWDDKNLFLIVNAGCKDKDFAYIQKKIGGQTKLQCLPDRALLALQGPSAEGVITKIFPAAAAMKFMTSTKFSYEGQEFYISRSGYTGEDGYEISVPAAISVAFAKKLLANSEVKWIGLGARDSLRLEAGLCLYGHDLDEQTTPVEANLKWVIPKRRREGKGFCGADKIVSQLQDGPSKFRVGIKPEGRAPLREGTELFSADGKKIGLITSGGFGPSADAPVAMGYVETVFSATGTPLQAMLRGSARPCAVTALPFIPHHYKKD
jgi:aminomethyltransferase